MTEESYPGPERIAVVGMAARFPGAPDVDAFWRNLRGGVESIARLTDEEVLASGADADLLSRPDFVRAYGVLDEADLFDPDFFDLTPRDAELMDPQHRLFLEQAWRALEHAGCDPSSFPGPIGVFGGSNLNSYLLALVARHGNRAADVLQARIRADKDFLTTLVSYKLDLRGPSYAVQTACSTSLVAVHLACQSLIDFHCDMALAGGVSVGAPLRGGYVAREGVLSPDGHCRAFDARGEGTVEAAGVGVVALKRLSDALADGDRVHAVILATAINNDGSQKVGFTAPSVEGQIEVVATAHALARVPAESITYVEAHGTGTPMGDPVEVTALTQAFGTESRGFCAIGSVKTNVGHLDAAAGVASLIKAVLALEHGEIPPSLHFEEPNPEIDFAGSPFYVADRLLPWAPPAGTPRRAGVSSFGIGGTNAHVVLEEAPREAVRRRGDGPELLVLSARTPEALEALGAATAERLESHPELDLGDVAFTLQQGRRAFPHRRALVAASAAEAAALLRSADPAEVVGGRAAELDPGVAFLFSGLGTQYAGMGRELYEREPAFRAAMDRCFAVLLDRWGMDLREKLYGGAAPAPAAGSGPDLRAMLRGTGGPSESDPLQGARWGHPAMFSVGWALAETWRSRGIEPRAVAGHSLGEYVAACVAGVFSLEDALTLVVRRAELLEPLRGSMAAVGLPEAEVRAVLADLAAEGDAPVLAAVNAPRSCVVSGTAGAVARFAERMRARGETVLPLAVRHPFHSPLLEPAREELGRVLAGMRRNAPEVPLAANATGRWLRPEEARSVEYWVEHLTAPVRFAECVERLRGLAGNAGEPVLLELGPGAVLGSWARQQGAERVAASLRHGEQGGSDLALLRRAVGQLWSWGVPVDWRRQEDTGGRRRVALPGHPMNRRRYWLLDLPATQAAAAGAPEGRLSATRWRQLPDAEDAGAEAFAGERVVVFGGAGAAPLADRLRAAGAVPVRVEAGDAFRAQGAHCTVRPGEPGDFARLAETLRARGWDGAVHALHLWCLDGGAVEAVADAPRRWAEALAGAGFPGEGSTLLAATRGARAVLGTEELHPAQAPVAALLPEAARALPGLRVRAADVETRAWEEAVLREAADLLEDGARLPEVAWRGLGRWEPFRAALAAPAKRGARTRLREGGVYLVAGGLGGAGLAIARYLAETARARLVLADAPDDTGRAELAARVLVAHGAEVCRVDADPVDADALRGAVAEAVERFGGLHGVVYAGEAPGSAVAGALALAAATGGETLDLTLLCSPAGDAAGAAFLDAFAAARTHSEGRPTVSVAWDTPDGATPLAGIDPAEGAELLGRLFAHGTGTQVTVRTGASAPAHPEAADGQVLHARPGVAPYVAPRTELERALVEMYGRALGVERIGVDDGFFELGGDSLLATQLLAGVNERFGVELPLRALFEAATPALLAAAVVQKQMEQVDDDLLARALAEL